MEMVPSSEIPRKDLSCSSRGCRILVPISMSWSTLVKDVSAGFRFRTNSKDASPLKSGVHRSSVASSVEIRFGCKINIVLAFFFLFEVSFCCCLTVAIVLLFELTRLFELHNDFAIAT